MLQLYKNPRNICKSNKETEPMILRWNEEGKVTQAGLEGKEEKRRRQRDYILIFKKITKKTNARNTIQLIVEKNQDTNSTHILSN